MAKKGRLVKVRYMLTYRYLKINKMTEIKNLTLETNKLPLNAAKYILMWQIFIIKKINVNLHF